MRKAPHPLFHGKADGKERCRCARDGTPGEPGRHQADGQLLECLGGSQPRSFSRSEIGSGRNCAENYRAVRASWPEGDRCLAILRRLALRSSEKRWRGDHGFWMLWSRMGALAEGPSDASLCNGSDT